MKWTEEQMARLRAAYSPGVTSREVDLGAMAKEMGRARANFTRKAKSMGLPPRERKKAKPPPPPMYASEAERRAAVGKRTKEYIAAHGHPRGALGMKHSAETLGRISRKVRDAWDDPASSLNGPALKAKRREQFQRLREAGKIPLGGFVQCAGRRRPDLEDRYFRSAWEANYARYLNLLKARGEILGWEYESKTFTFDRISRGTRSYTPDFKVLRPDGGHEWHEVKGWMNQRSRTRMKRMAKYYPEETVLIIGSDWFRRANRSGGVSMLIPKWERKARP